MAINKVEDVHAGITKFENNIREYVMAGGERPNEKEMKNDLMDALPQELRENLMWRLPVDEPFVSFRDHVRTAANTVLYHRGKIGHSVNNVDRDSGLNANDGNTKSQIEDMVGAIMNKMGFKNGKTDRPPWTDRPPRQPGADLQRPRRCANCSSEKHPTAECPSPKVPLNKRPCHSCGLPGHTSSNCKSRNRGRPAGAVEAEGEVGNGTDYFGCVTFESKPKPKQITLSDFIPTVTKNAFEDLASSEEFDDDSDSNDEPNTQECRKPRMISQRQMRKKIKKERKLQRREEGTNQNPMVTSKDDIDNFLTAAVEYSDTDDDDVMNVTDEVEVNVALDSGCICHTASKKDIPASIHLDTTGRLRNFVAANNTRMKNYGKVNVEMVQEEGNVLDGSFHITDVTRPLHASGQICDESKEILMMKHEAVVVPAGSLSRFLGMVRKIAKYKRENGLYLAKMKIRVPRGTRTSDAKDQPNDRGGAKSAGFGRQGVKS